MTARDPRLSDDRVKAGRRANWLVGEDQWPDAPSILDVLDRPTVDDTLNPPARPIRADEGRDFGPVLPPVRDTSTVKVAAVLAFGIVCFILGSLAMWAVHLMVVAS